LADAKLEISLRSSDSDSKRRRDSMDDSGFGDKDARRGRPDPEHTVREGIGGLKRPKAGEEGPLRDGSPVNRGNWGANKRPRSNGGRHSKLVNSLPSL
jgi:hypothetical protein